MGRAGPTAAPGPAGTVLPDGLPDGVIELAGDRWRHAEDRAERAGLRPEPSTDDRLTERLRQELTAPLRLEDWPAPAEPHQVTGGWVNIEVIDEDRAALEAVLATRGRSGPEATARAAQEMRLPVTPYRHLSDRAPVEDAAVEPAGPQRRRPDRPGAPLVVDLTTHWAGPLATSLLAEAGAEVIKIDPSCRPDGFRARPGLYHHLNGTKRVVDLDLRRPPDRHRFETLLADADLLVESFARRVLPNLGYDRATLARINPSIGVVSIKAFPAASPEAEWLAYGPGVHAASGLGTRTGRAVPAPVAYPDLVAGVTAYGHAVTLLAAGGGRAEVSLAGSIVPLVGRAVGRRHQDRTSRG